MYSYILDYDSKETVRGTDFEKGSPHASDITMKFITAAAFGPKRPARLKTASNMSSMWVSFAHASVPAASGQTVWKPYTLENRETMIIDDKCRLVNDPESIERQFWSQEPDADIESPNR